MAYEMSCYSRYSHPERKEPPMRGPPGCIIFLIDRSGSMKSQFGSSGDSCAYGAADAVNSIVEEQVLRCMWNEYCVPSLLIGLYGYAGDSVEWAAPKFPPQEDGLVNISKLAECDDYRFDEAKEVYIPLIVEEQAHGDRPTRAAFEKATQIARNYALNYPDSFPPIIVNISNGPPTDCEGKDLPDIASPLMGIETSDGATIVFNIHLSTESSESVFFPNIGDSLPEEYAENLLAASSEPPSGLYYNSPEKKYWRFPSDIPLPLEGSRCLVFNADERLLHYSLFGFLNRNITLTGSFIPLGVCDKCGLYFMTGNLLNRHKDDAGHWIGEPDQ